MEKKPSWEDISSLKLEMDTGSSEDNSGAPPAGGKLTAQNITNMLLDDIKVLPVQVTVKETILSPKGAVEYLLQGGMCFSLPGHNLTVNTIVSTETVLGKQIFKIEAYVHQVDGDRVEITFMDAGEEYTTFFKDILSAKVLNYKI